MLTPDEAQRLLRGGEAGVAEWNKRRQDGEQVDNLSQIDLSNVDLYYTDADLSSLCLRKANFKNANLHSVVLTGADLSEANLEGTDLSAALGDTILRKANLRNSGGTDASFGGTDLTGAYLEGAGFSMAECPPGAVILNEAYWPAARFDPAQLQECAIEKARMPGALISESDFTKTSFNGSDLSKATIETSTFRAVNLANTNLEGAHIIESDFSGADLSNCNLQRAEVKNVNLRGANLTNANLTDAKLIGVQVDRFTRLEGAQVKGCRIDRYALECMIDYGGLTRGDLMHMNVVDGLATLRQSFSGLFLLLHISALVTFTSPYVWFLANKYAMSQFGDTQFDASIPLWLALCRYIASGGTQWKEPVTIAWYPFSLFLIALGYNICRAVLLWKTKKLEVREQALGFPSAFSLEGSRLWSSLYLVMRVGFMVYVLVILGHTWHFLSQRVPL